jgi:hypothetical protein
MNGVEFDRVVKISDKVSGKDSLSEQTRKLVEILAEILATRHSYPTSDDIDYVCCSTVTAGKDHYGELVADIKTHRDDFSRFWSIRNRIITDLHGRGQICGGSASDRFIATALTNSRGRRLFHTAKGYIGLGSAASQPGDLICVLCGGSVPVTLRKAVHKNPLRTQFLFVGEAYIHGIMHGEAVSNGREDPALVSFEIN